MQDPYALAAAQHGVVSRAQLTACGIPQSTVSEWARRGRLNRIRAGVFAVAGAAGSDYQTLMAAVLAAGEGAVASHRSAGWLWGFLDELVLELTVPRGRRPRISGVIVHHPLEIAGTRHSIRKGIAATNPMRTLCDLGGVVPIETVSDAMERALTDRLVSTRALRAEVERLTVTRRRGAAVVRAALDARALSDRPPDSVLESRMATLFRRFRLPKAVYQHTVRFGGRFIARVDFAYPDCLLAIEVDGHDSRKTPAQLRADLARQNRLVGAGWTVLRFTWADVVDRPEEVAATIGAQLARLRAR